MTIMKQKTIVKFQSNENKDTETTNRQLQVKQ